jgi:hypothetical protein
VANQTSILFPTDSRPLRDLRVAQGRIEASNGNGNTKGKSAGPHGDQQGRSTSAGRQSRSAPGMGWDSRSPVGRVRQFMERYARVIGEGLTVQPDLGATLVGVGPEPTVPVVAAPPVSRNGETESSTVTLNTLIGQAHSALHAAEQEDVVILEETTDAVVPAARQFQADNEIVFIE